MILGDNLRRGGFFHATFSSSSSLKVTLTPLVWKRFPLEVIVQSRSCLAGRAKMEGYLRISTSGFSINTKSPSLARMPF